MKKKFDPAALPQESLSQHVLCEEYAAPGETTLLQVRQRVARALASDARQEARFLQAQLDGFVPESSVNKAAGLNATATMLNCFVQPVPDTLTGSVDGLPGIMDALAQTAHTMRRGGHVALDFSRLRPKGAKVTGLPSNAGGPLPYMRVFDCMCDTMGSDASPRAGLGVVLRIDHPDVVEFIGGKDAANSQQLLPLIPRNPALSNMNLCVAVTDEFMEAVINDRMFSLAHVAAPAFDAPLVNCADRIQRYVYRVVQARELWACVVRSAGERGGPAVLNLDAINRGNNLWYVERFETTSPGGEQPLPPYGACCGGSVNLALRAGSVQQRRAIRPRCVRACGRGRGGNARSRPGRDDLATAAACRGSRSEAAHRTWALRAGRRPGDAGAALRLAGVRAVGGRSRANRA